MAVTTALSWYRGENVPIQWTLKIKEDITGWTLLLTVKVNADDETAVFTQAGVVTDGANGIFTVTVPALKSDQDAGEYVYDVWRTDAGSETELANGTVTILERVRE